MSFRSFCSKMTMGIESKKYLVHQAWSDSNDQTTYAKMCSLTNVDELHFWWLKPWFENIIEVFKESLKFSIFSERNSFYNLKICFRIIEITKKGPIFCWILLYSGIVSDNFLLWKKESFPRQKNPKVHPKNILRQRESKFFIGFRYYEASLWKIWCVLAWGCPNAGTPHFCLIQKDCQPETQYLRDDLVSGKKNCTPEMTCLIFSDENWNKLKTGNNRHCSFIVRESFGRLYENIT